VVGIGEDSEAGVLRASRAVKCMVGLAMENKPS